MDRKDESKNKPLTKKRFEALLTKAAQPLPKTISAPEGRETEGVHPSDGCSETDKNQGKTEGGED